MAGATNQRSRIRLEPRFTGRLVLRDPLLGGGLAFLMTCPRTATHEETELLTVLYIPFREATPIGRLIPFTRLVCGKIP